jgi:hypothetical protein
MLGKTSHGFHGFTQTEFKIRANLWQKPPTTLNCGDTQSGNWTKIVILIGDGGHWLVKKYRCIFQIGKHAIVCYSCALRYQRTTRNKDEKRNDLTGGRQPGQRAVDPVALKKNNIGNEAPPNQK